METGETDEERIGELYKYNYLGWLMESRKPMTVEDGEVRYQLIQYQYDKAGNRTVERRYCDYQTKESAGGTVHTITYRYDADDRLIQVSDCTGAVLEYQYDSQNRRIYEKRKINDTANQILRSRYDGAGRLVELTRIADKESCGRRSLSVKYEYDKNGNTTRILLPAGGEILREYDAVDRLIKERHLDKNGGIDNTTRFSYDKAGNLTCITDNCGRKTRLEYDLMNREIRRIEKDGSVTRQFYDKNGQRIKTILPREYHRAGDMGAGTQYTYDAMNRLRKLEYPGRKEELFYDKAGNRTKRVCNGMEELYCYDKRNRLIAYTKGGVHTEFEYNNAGNLLKDDKARYEYDAFNRNTKVETFSGDIQINRYDGEGLRHEMEENGKMFTFIFRGTEIVAEESKEDKIRYIRTGELLASDAESARTYYHYASDEMGSITHVVVGEEKESGNHAGEGITGSVRNRYEYDARGNLTTCEEKIKNRFKNNGQQYDQVSGRYYLRARYYNPVIGRFTQEDTYRGDGLNLYAYCKNNPVYYVDPSEHNVCPKAVERISSEISENRASQADRDRLSNHLQGKINAGENLTGAEKRAAEQLGIDTSKGNTTSSVNSNASDGYIHRGMKEDKGKPAAGDSARTLGVRPDIDIPVDANGMVYPNTGGMSAAPSAEALPTHRKPPEFGGTGKAPVWKIDINDLGPDLTYVPDSPQHGTVQPTRPMTLDDYQKALANTNANWEKEECP